MYFSILKVAFLKEQSFLSHIAQQNNLTATDTEGNLVAPPVVGDMVGRVRIEAIIGSGGNAIIYKGDNVQLQKPAAIKIIRPEAGKNAQKRFLTEAKICSKLDHPNIVKVYNVGYWKDSLPYCELEYVNGISIHQYLKQQKRLPVPAALAVISLLCTILNNVYRKKFSLDGKPVTQLLHRDLKPANILITSEGTLKIIDFGLAKFEDVSLNTIEGTNPGTLSYMAPEQHSTNIANMKTEVYSLGVMLFEMLTGERPFPEKGYDALLKMMEMKQAGTIPKIKDIVPDFSDDEVSLLIDKCLAPKPEDRFKAFSSLMISVQAVLSDYTDVEDEQLLSTFITDQDRYRTLIFDKQKKRSPYPLIIILGAITAAALVLSLFLIANKSEKDITIVTQNHEIKKSQPAATENKPQQQLPQKTGPVKTLKKVQNTVAPQHKRPMQSTRQKQNPVKRAPTPKRASTTQNNHAQSNQNPFARFTQNYKAKNYKTLIASHSTLSMGSLTPSQQDSAAIMYIEACLHSGELSKLFDFAAAREVNDGMYFLIIGEALILSETPSEGLKYLNRAMHTETFFNSKKLKRETLYNQAKAYYNIYKNDNNSNNKAIKDNACRTFLDLYCVNPVSKECVEIQKLEKK